MAELKFKFIGDDSDVRKKLAELAKLQAESGKAFGEALKKSLDNAATSHDLLKKAAEATKQNAAANKELAQAQKEADAQAVRESQLAYMESLRASRLEIQDYREERARLRVAYEEGRISQQQYRIESAKLSLEERKKAAALREAKKEIAQNSEYQKLNRALGELRTRSKDVLAEMYKLERQGKKNTAEYKNLANEARGLVAQTQTLDAGLKKIDVSLGLHQRNVGNYGSALDAISPQFARVNSQMQMMGVNLTELAGSRNPFKELGASIIAMGKNIGKFLLSPVGLVITALASLYGLIRANGGTVKEFNSGMLDVSKTTGISGAALDRLSKDVVQLSRDLQVVDTSKLTEYATVAGQLGVKGSQNILAFTGALAKLETASDITGEKGGAEIARLLTLTDGGVQNVKAFGDEIVNLGNNFAATESEILGNATAIAQNTGLYRIGRQDALAYATATKAVGLEAEVVGSAMFRTLAQLEKYANGAKGTERVLALLGTTQEKLSAQFKTDSASVFNDLIAALNNIDRSGGNVTETLNRLGLNNVRDIRVLGTLASSGYGQLQEAMISVEEAAGSLDAEFSTAAGKLENETKRINIAWKNLVLDIENGTGAIGKSVVWLSGILADALDRIAKIANPTGWNEFTASLTSFQAADAIREINLAVKEGSEVLQETANLDFSNAKIKDLEQLFGDLTTAQDGATKALETYKKGIESGLLSDKGKTKIEDLEKMLNSLSSQITRVSMFIPDPVTPTGGVGDTNDDNLSDSERKALERQHKQRLRAQRSLQAEIDKIIATSRRGQLTKEEADLKAIEDRYVEYRRKIASHREEGGYKVDASGLAAAQAREEEEARANHQVDLDKKIFAERKVLFNEYQNYVGQVGKAEADKRFSEELGGFKTYVEYLKSLMPEETDQSVYANKLRDALRTETANAEKDEKKRLEERYTAALMAARTHAQNLEAIEAEYQENISALGKEASAEQLEVLKRTRDERISAEVSGNLKILNNWDETFSRMALMSKSAVGKWLEDVRTRVQAERDAGKLTEREYNSLMDRITHASERNKTSFSRLRDAVRRYLDLVRSGKKDNEKFAESMKILGAAIADAGYDTTQVLNELSEAFRTLGIGSESLEKAMRNIEGVVDGASKIGEGLAPGGNPIDVVTGSIKLLSNAINLFNTRDRKLQRQIEGYQKQLDSLGKAYRKLEKDISNSVGNAFYGDSNAIIANMERQIAAIEKMREAEQKKKKTDKSKIAAYDDEILALRDSIEQTEKAISEMLLQDNFKQFSANLTNALVSAFEAGEDGIQAMNDTFDQFIKNAIAGAMRMSMIEPIVNKMMKDATAYARENDNSLIGFDFDQYRRDLTDAVSLGKQMYEGAIKDFGIDTPSTGSNKQGMGIAGITEKTAGRLESEIGGLRLAQLQALEVAKGQTSLMQQNNLYALQSLSAALAIRDNTFKSATNSDHLPRLASIERAIVDLNSKITNTDALRRGAGAL